MVLSRSFAVWLMMMFCESLNGTFRELFLVSAVGQNRAKQISFLVGAVIILSLAIALIHWIGPDTRYKLLGIGIFWAGLTFGFEILLGLFALGYPIERLAREFDPRTGSLLPLGILILIAAPFIAARIRGPLIMK